VLDCDPRSIRYRAVDTEVEINQLLFEVDV